MISTTHRGRGQCGQPRPWHASDAITRGDDAGGEHADREQRRELRRDASQFVRRGHTRAEQAHRNDRHGDRRQHGGGAQSPAHQHQQREDQIELGLDRDGPKRAVGYRCRGHVLQEQAIDND